MGAADIELARFEMQPIPILRCAQGSMSIESSRVLLNSHPVAIAILRKKSRDRTFAFLSQPQLIVVASLNGFKNVVSIRFLERFSR